MNNASSVIRNAELQSLTNQLELESRFFIIQSKVIDQWRTKVCKDDIKSKQFLWMTKISVQPTTSTESPDILRAKKTFKELLIFQISLSLVVLALLAYNVSSNYQFISNKKH